MAEDVQEAPETQAATRSGGSMKLLLIVVVVLLVALLGAAAVLIINMRSAAAEPGAAPLGKNLSQVQIVEEPKTTTNRLNQVLKWEVTLQIHDNEEGELAAEWSQPDKRALLQDMVIEVVQGLDLSQARPHAVSQFKTQVRSNADTLMGQEGTVERVLVTEWVAAGGGR
jgi:flagellar basal body-associated protein FliL